MTVLTWPSGLQPSRFRLDLQTSQRVNASPFGGSEQAVDLLNDRWLCSMELPRKSFAAAAAIEGFLANFRGQNNTVGIWHMARTVPYGTASTTASTWVVSNASQGASSLTLTAGAGQSGQTLLVGDLFSVGSLLFMVGATCTASGAGVLTVPIVNRLRSAISGSPYALLSSPLAYFRLLNSGGIGYAELSSDAVALTFGEAI